MANTTNLQMKISAIDKASSVISGIEQRFTTMASKVASAASTLAVGGIAALGAGLTVSAKKGLEFENAMRDISTLITGDSTEAMAELNEGILAIAKNSPKSAQELGEAAYDILSAGVSGAAEQMAVLDASQRLAVAGLGDTKGSVDILTSSINAFGLDAANADAISDVLFKTVKNGKTTVDQMAQAFGATAPVIASAGISLEEFSAATAALTTTGMPASQAQNSLRAAVVALQKPTTQMADLFKKLGYESGQAALEEHGMVEVMYQVAEAANWSAQDIGMAFGSVEALGAVMSLTGDQAESFRDTLFDMNGGASAIGEAFEKQFTPLEKMKALFDEIIVKVGVGLQPALQKLADKAVEVFPQVEKAVVNFWKKAQPVLVNFLKRARDVFPKVVSFVQAIYKKVKDIMPKVTGFIAGVATFIKDDFLPRVQSIRDALGEFADKFSGVGEKASSFLPIVTDLLENGINFLLDGVKVLVEKMTDMVTWFQENEWAMDLLKVVAIALGTALTLMAIGFGAVALWAGATAIAVGAVNIAFAILTSPILLLIAAIALLVGLVVVYWDEIKSFTLGLVEAIKGFFIGLKDKTVEIFTNIKNWVVEKFTNMKNSASTAVENIKNFFGTLPGRVLDFLVTMKDNFVNKLTEIKDKVDYYIKLMLNFFLNLPFKVLEYLKEMKDHFTDKLKEIVTKVQEKVQEIKDWFGGLPGHMLQIGKDMVAKLFEGIGDLGGKINNAVQSAWNFAVGSLPGNADGTGYFEGGLTMVGERGPELVQLPRGSKISSNTASLSQGSGGGQSNTYNFDFSGAVVSDRDSLESFIVETIANAQKQYQQGA